MYERFFAPRVTAFACFVVTKSVSTVAPIAENDLANTFVFGGCAVDGCEVFGCVVFFVVEEVVVDGEG